MRIARGLKARHLRGMASLEFALALPLLAMMGFLIFACARAEVDRAEAVVRARTSAWAHRFDDSSSAEAIAPPVSTRLEWLTPGDPGRGLRRAEVPVSARLLARLVRRAIDLRARHAVLGGAWDSAEIPLGDRAPLAPHPLIERFGRLPVDPSRLRDMLGGFVTGNADAIGRASSGLDPALANVDGAIRPLEQAVESRQAAVEAAAAQLNGVDAAIARATDPSQKEALEREGEALQQTLGLRRRDLARAAAALARAREMRDHLQQGSGR